MISMISEDAVSDLLIRNIKPQLKRKLVERARKRGHSLSAEAQELIERGLVAPPPEKNLGEWLYSLVPEQYRGDDLVFEIPDDREITPPDFE
jgi:Antitoxin FitA-like, ribbon-helix-helix